MSKLSISIPVCHFLHCHSRSTNTFDVSYLTCTSPWARLDLFQTTPDSNLLYLLCLDGQVSAAIRVWNPTPKTSSDIKFPKIEDRPVLCANNPSTLITNMPISMCRIVRRVYACGNIIEQRYHTSGCGGRCACPPVELMHHSFLCDDASHNH